MFKPSTPIIALVIAGLVSGCASAPLPEEMRGVDQKFTDGVTKQLSTKIGSANFSDSPVVKTPSTRPINSELKLQNTELHTMFEKIVGNPEMAQAQAKLRQAIASKVLVNSERYPQLAYKQTESTGEVAPLYASARDLVFSWELDVFSKNAESVEASDFQIVGKQYDYTNSKLMLEYTVAQTYLDALNCKAQLELLEKDIDLKQKLVATGKAKKEAGLLSTFDYLKVETQLADALLGLKTKQTGCAAINEELYRITGVSFSGSAQDIAQLYQQMTSFEGSIPLAYVRHRPDVKSMEAQIFSNVMAVSSASKSWLPSFTFNGVISTLGTLATGAWQAVIGMTITLVDSGKAAANEEIAQSKLDEAKAMYQAKLNTIVKEVTLANLQVVKTTEKAQITEAQSIRNMQLLKMAEAKYEYGSISIIDLMDTAKLVLQAEQATTNVQIERMQAIINVYKSLGLPITLQRA